MNGPCPEGEVNDTELVATQSVLIAVRVHPFPSRTRQLSSLAPKILGWRRPGKIGSADTKKRTAEGLSAFFALPEVNAPDASFVGAKSKKTVPLIPYSSSLRSLGLGACRIPLQCCAHFLIRTPEILSESNPLRCGQSLFFMLLIIAGWNFVFCMKAHTCIAAL